MENCNNVLRDFLLSLHLIHLKLKKPPDGIRVPKQSDSASQVDDPESR